MVKKTTEHPLRALQAKKQTEGKLQQDCFMWFWNTFPDLRRTMWHIPNGGKRSEIAGSRLKGAGMVAGATDLVWFYSAQVYLFELKTTEGTLSPDQKKTHSALLAQGFNVSIIRSIEQFKSQVTAIKHGFISNNTLLIPE